MAQSRKISNYKRGYQVIDRLCGAFLIVSIVGGMGYMIGYANARDYTALSNDKQLVISVDK